MHATLAGVAIGLLAPARPLLNEEVARGYAAERAARQRHLDADELARMRFLLKESVSVVERLQSTLHPVSAYVVLPVFALANAGVELGAIGKVFTEPVGPRHHPGARRRQARRHLRWRRSLAVRLGLGRLPDGTTWPMVLGLGAVGGIGFTVSIFIAGLSFPGADLLTEEAKIAILLASLVAAVVGVARAPRLHQRSGT